MAIKSSEVIKFFKEHFTNLIEGTCDENEFMDVWNFCKTNLKPFPQQTDKWGIKTITSEGSKLLQTEKIVGIQFFPLAAERFIIITCGNTEIIIGRFKNSNTELYLKINKHFSKTSTISGKNMFFVKNIKSIQTLINWILNFKADLYEVTRKCSFGETVAVFPFNDEKKIYKRLKCERNAIGKIIDIKPYKEENDDNKKPIKNTQPKWKVIYDDGDDISNVWVYADNKNDAINQVKSEYYDCKKVISVIPLKESVGKQVFNIKTPDNLFEGIDMSNANPQDLIAAKKLYNYIVESNEIAKKENVELGQVLDDEVTEGLLTGILGGISGATFLPPLMKAFCDVLGLTDKSVLRDLLCSKLVMGALGMKIGYSF